MAAGPGQVAIEDVIRARIIAADGRVLGRVIDLEVTPAPEYRVTAVLYGTAAWLYRFNVLEAITAPLGRRLEPKRICWDDVDRLEPHALHLRPNARPEPVRQIEGH